MDNRLEQRAYDVFSRIFEQEVNKGHTHRTAFDKVNAEMEKKAGFQVYGSYESFKNARHRKKSKSK